MNRISQPSTGPSPTAITRRSHDSSSCPAKRRLVAACGLALALLAMMPSCARTPATLVIPADRAIERQADGRYVVSAAWLQERFELERALQLHLDRCEAQSSQKSSAWIRPADREFLIRGEEQVQTMRRIGALATRGERAERVEP